MTNLNGWIAAGLRTKGLPRDDIEASAIIISQCRKEAIETDLEILVLSFPDLCFPSSFSSTSNSFPGSLFPNHSTSLFCTNAQCSSLLTELVKFSPSIYQQTGQTSSVLWYIFVGYVVC